VSKQAQRAAAESAVKNIGETPWGTYILGCAFGSLAYYADRCLTSDIRDAKAWAREREEYRDQVRKCRSILHGLCPWLDDFCGEVGKAEPSATFASLADKVADLKDRVADLKDRVAKRSAAVASVVEPAKA